MSRNIILALTALTFTSATAVAAEGPSGFYAKGYLGLSTLQGNDLSIDGVSSDLSYGSSLGVGGALGYDYSDSPFRAEVAYAYRRGNAEDLPADVGSGGDFASTTVSLNGYYMFDVGKSVTPYVGAGIGYVTEVDFDIDDATGAPEYSDTGLFSYQLMAGAEVPLSDQLAVFAEARYFSIDTPKLTAEDGSTLRADYDTLDLVTGLTWSF